ncbi:unnamed protein product, partial [Hymenolepis diminuta]
MSCDMPCHPEPRDAYCEHQYLTAEFVECRWVFFSDPHLRYFTSLFTFVALKKKTDRHLICCHVFLDFVPLSRMEWNLGAES